MLFCITSSGSGEKIIYRHSHHVKMQYTASVYFLSPLIIYFVSLLSLLILLLFLLFIVYRNYWFLIFIFHQSIFDLFYSYEYFFKGKYPRNFIYFFFINKNYNIYTYIWIFIHSRWLDTRNLIIFVNFYFLNSNIGAIYYTFFWRAHINNNDKKIIVITLTIRKFIFKTVKFEMPKS